jgi:hypothetical protein
VGIVATGGQVVSLQSQLVAPSHTPRTHGAAAPEAHYTPGAALAAFPALKRTSARFRARQLGEVKKKPLP